jgi:hypothetical protein
MRDALCKRDNWEYLRSYGLSVYLDGEEKWAKVTRIEDTRGNSLALEDSEEVEGSEGEVLIHVHTEDDVWKEYRDTYTD